MMLEETEIEREREMVLDDLMMVSLAGISQIKLTQSTTD